MSFIRDIFQVDDFAHQALSKRFYFNHFFRSVVINKLNSLGKCIYKRNKFSKVIINTMNEIGRREISNDEFVEFVTKAFNEIKSVPDQGPLITYQPPSVAKRGPDYAKTREYVNGPEKGFQLPHSVRQQVAKHIDYTYLKQMDIILKDIRSANNESEANLISLCESVGYVVNRLKESKIPIDDFRTLVYNRYTALRSKPHWNIQGGNR